MQPRGACEKKWAESWQMWLSPLVSRHAIGLCSVKRMGPNVGNAAIMQISLTSQTQASFRAELAESVYSLICPRLAADATREGSSPVWPLWEWTGEIWPEDGHVACSSTPVLIRVGAKLIFSYYVVIKRRQQRHVSVCRWIFRPMWVLMVTIPGRKFTRQIW